MRKILGTSGLTIADVVIIFLLIVIAAAILFPIFCHGQPERRYICQSNLKEIVRALEMYQHDYDEVLPSSILYGGSETWNRNDFIHFATETSDAQCRNNSTGCHQTWSMLLTHYLKYKDIIWCPSDPENQGDSSGQPIHTTYWYKAAVDRAWYGDGKSTFRKDQDFDCPSGQVVFYEHNGWHLGQADRGLKDGVAVNMAFLDGHVYSKKIANSGFKTSKISPAPGVGEPAWFNHNLKTNKNNTAPNWNPTVYSDDLQ